MKVLLLHDARIRHKAGEIVEVSPEEAGFLLSVNAAALPASEKPENPETKKAAETRRRK